MSTMPSHEDRMGRAVDRRRWALARSVLLTVAVMIVTVAAMVPVLLSRNDADAETPAERCARETAAYNSAWAQSWAVANGQPASQAPHPPVPYVCHDPGTTTNTTAPPSVTAPGVGETTGATTGTGPGVGAQAPTDIPTTTPGQSPIVEAPDSPRSAVPSSVRQRESQASGVSLPPGDAASSGVEPPRSGEVGPSASPTSNPAHPRPEVQSAREPNNLLLKPQKARLDGCPEGHHRNNFGFGVPGTGGGKCYPDFDYNIISTRYERQTYFPEHGPVSSCTLPPGSQNTCTFKYDRSKSVANSVETSEEVSGAAGFDLEAVNAGVESSVTKTTGRSVEDMISNGTDVQVSADALGPNHAADAYTEYAQYSYVMQKYSTQEKKVVWTKTFYYYVPTGLRVVARE
ncbi:hypothetical protein GIY30_02090 [Gordonia sp. HNM0687]|uniref:Uncharacterized protein n=1 Tax=Gordonia mangrovi TaxID=2665643 RepID=A0A6L7GLN4_9ACTN|nr:DUF1772 domain-containing protein [Gordonia mangrovi]MXP20161.1 hypothetical protein [Gordonia mangrovi]UVF79232.1 hypothetical protein NWF22_05150 [Gordonia mangrovi]